MTPNRIPHLFLSLLIIGCLNGQVGLADEKVFMQLQNPFPTDVKLWIWPQEIDCWRRDKIEIKRNDASTIPLLHPGSHYFKYRDNQQNDTHLGWFDVEQVKKLAKPISLTMITKTKPETKTVMVTVTEDVSTDVTILVPVTKTKTIKVLVNGKYIDKEITYTENVPETRTKTTQVTKLVPQTYTKEISYSAPVLQGADGAQFEGKFNQATAPRRLGLSCSTSQHGCKVEKVNQNSPAKRACNEDGEVFEVEVGDVVMSVDGVPVKTVDDIIKQMDKAQEFVTLQVLDKNINQWRILTVRIP